VGVAADQVAGAGEGDVAGVVGIALGRVEVVGAVGFDDESGRRPEKSTS